MKSLLRERVLDSKLVLDLNGLVKDNDGVYIRGYRKIFKMDNSMYTTWACPMKGILSHVLKLRPRGKSSLAMDFGTCIHAGLEQFFRSNGLLDALQAFEVKAQELGIDRWLDNYRNSERGAAMLAGWDEWRKERELAFETVEIAGETAVELGVEKLIDRVADVDVLWIGRVDAVVRYKGQLWIIDHKTSSMLGAKFINDKLRSSQFLGYYYALNDLVTEQFGKPLAGVLLNVICTGTKEVKFELYELPFQQWQIDEWLEETRLKLYNIMKTINTVTDNAETIIPVEREVCVTKYGDCPFFQVCNACSNARENILNQLYEEHDWNPHDDAKIIKG